MLVGAALAALVLVAGGLYGYQTLAGKIQTFNVSGMDAHRPAHSGGSAENVLLIGSDARGGENTKLGGQGAAVGRSDTTLMVHVYPGHTSAVAVSIPRDTLVTIPSCRLPDGAWTQPQAGAMFNSAFSVGLTPTGNPACTVNTVEHMTGLRIDHTVVANFAGFAAMSAAVGGVTVCLPRPVYQGDLDPNLGYQGNVVFRAGRQTVEGAKALQYVRVRHGLGDGSDIGRIQRQQAFLASMVMTIRRQGLSPTHVLPLVDAATKSLTFDPSLDSPQKLFSFAMALRGVNPGHIDFVTMPWRYNGPRVSIVQPDANRLWAALRDNRPIDPHAAKSHAHRARAHGSARPAGSGTVTVLNGTWTAGLAARAAAHLDQAGFTATAGNAVSHDYPRSEIRYPGAETTSAETLARYIDAELVPDPQASGLTLILGSAHRWLSAPGSKPKHSELPASVTNGIRRANANPCSNLTYG